MNKINQYALDNYTPSKYPKLHADVGNDGLKAIEAHNKTAAELVANLNSCDEVIYVGHSKDTQYPDHLVSFVDCKNEMRFFVTNGELES